MTRRARTHARPATALALCCALSAALLLTGCVTAEPPRSTAMTADAVAAVEVLERQRFAALERNELTALEPVLAADLVYCHSTGRCETRGEFLAALRDGSLRYRRIELLELRGRALGTAVLLHGRVLLDAEMAGQQARMQLVYTDVWARRDGRWQLIAWQSTRAPAPAQP